MTIARSINVICGHYPIQSLWPLPQHKTHIATLYIYCWTSTLMCCPFIYGDTYCRTWMHIYIYHFSLHANHSETYGSCSGIQAYCCVVCCLSDESGSKEGIACKLSGTSKWCDAGGPQCAYLALWHHHFFFLWHVHSSFLVKLFILLFIFLSLRVGGSGKVFYDCRYVWTRIPPQWGQLATPSSSRCHCVWNVPQKFCPFFDAFHVLGFNGTVFPDQITSLWVLGRQALSLPIVCQIFLVWSR